MLSVIRLYRWIGILGIAFLTVAFGIGLACSPPPGFLSRESLGMLAGYCLHAGILGTSIYVSVAAKLGASFAALGSHFRSGAKVITDGPRDWVKPL